MRKLSGAVGVFLMLAGLLVAGAAAGAEVALEIDGGLANINPKEFKDHFLDDYLQTLNPTGPYDLQTWQTQKYFEASGSLKYFVRENLALSLNGAYSHADLDYHVKLDGVECLSTHLGVPVAYLGLGADYYLPLASRFSLVFGAEAGVFAQEGLNYQIKTQGDSAAQQKLSDLGMAVTEVSGGTGPHGQDLHVGGKAKLGFQYMFTHVSGLVLYGGYQVARVMVKYPDQAPFTDKSASGDMVFSPAVLDLSGIFAKAGLVLYWGKENPAALAPAPASAPGSASVTPPAPKSKLPSFSLSSPPRLQRTEAAKFQDVLKTGNYFLPHPDSRVEFYMASTPGRPESVPALRVPLPRVTEAGNTVTVYGVILAAPTLNPSASPLKNLASKAHYSDAFAGQFVDLGADAKRWFACNLKNAGQAKQILWQVAKVRFDPRPKIWENPAGLIQSGKIPATQKEFMLDFSELGKTRLKMFPAQGLRATLQKPMTSALKTPWLENENYYIRALPLDAHGQLIGEADQGLQVTVGHTRTNPANYIPKYELWTNHRTNAGDYSVEFPDPLAHYPDAGVPADDIDRNKRKLFVIHGLKGMPVKAFVQVANRPFEAADKMDMKQGLVYSQEVELPLDTTSIESSLKPQDHPELLSGFLVPFAQFAPKASAMEAGTSIDYYVRALVLKEGSAPGTLDVQATEAIKVAYGKGEPVKLFGPKYQPIDYALPNLKIKNYVPIHEQSEAFNYFYYVYTTPHADDITCVWKKTENDALYPYRFPYDTWYMSQGIMTKAQYEVEVIPKYLPVGTWIHFVVTGGHDDSWLEEAWNAFVDFLSDIVNYVASLVNTVSAAYNNFKAQLIDFVVQICPEGFRGPFRMIVEGFVDYGLCVVGLPPSLPNFDELSNMSLTYMAEVALTEAGVPANDMTETLVANTAKELGTQLANAARIPAPNPVNAPFLKLNPYYMYRPAYVDVEMSNPSDYWTVPGEFDLSVNFKFDYWNMDATSTNPGGGLFYYGSYYCSPAFKNHFKHGLNANLVDYKDQEAVYDLFSPVLKQGVQQLRPHETQTVRIYLDPYYGKGSYARYPGGEPADMWDFNFMYYINGHKDFTHFSLRGHFMTAQQYAVIKLNKVPDYHVEYQYRTSSPGTQQADEQQKPVDRAW